MLHFLSVFREAQTPDSWSWYSKTHPCIGMPCLWPRRGCLLLLLPAVEAFLLKPAGPCVQPTHLESLRVSFSSGGSVPRPRQYSGPSPIRAFPAPGLAGLADEDEDEEVMEKGSQFTEADRKFMRRAVELASKAQGKTRPNPIVGCVVVNDAGEVVGEGFHPKAGEPHAEVFALRDAGDRAKGATAYVSLEPCNHHGRTPPCVDALLKAGVRKVVAGMVDPFPMVAGKGLERLRENGVEVLVGCEEERCREANAPFIHRVLHKAVRGQLHLTYHGRAFALPSPDNLRLSLGERFHAPHDAFIAQGTEGVGRLGADPDLPASAFRVIMADGGLASLPLEAPLWAQAPTSAGVLVFATSPLSAQDHAAAAALRTRGVEVVEVESADVSRGHVAPSAVQSALYERGLLSAFWLLDGDTAMEAVRSQCIQELSVHASLVEADELDDLSERFGVPMSVSVMSCDAAQEHAACILSVEVDSHGQRQHHGPFVSAI